MNKNDIVYVSKCNSYDEVTVYNTLKEMFDCGNLLDFIKPNMVIAIKANLVSASNPSTGTTTHPVIISMLAKLIHERNATCIVGDSPGGLFNEATLKHIYKECKLLDIENSYLAVNHNFETSIKHIDGRVCKQLDVSNWLLECDAIINVCKLKSHGMMGLSNSAKNMFGSVPGILKPEYHYRYKSHDDFARMILDINEFYKPSLNIVDGIIAMEGNGPTQGKPYMLNTLMASRNPFNLDIIASSIIGLDYNLVGTIKIGIEEDITYKDSLDINVKCINFSSINELKVSDFKLIVPSNNMEFKKIGGIFRKPVSFVLDKVLATKPILKKKKCIKCKKCMNICPAFAISFQSGYPQIDREKCIKCFCCQEFCPLGAMKTKQNFIIKLLGKRK